ncbi:MAG: type II toxin-antitoxin system VapC family toxin [Mycobacteriales bacterium]
MSIYLDTSALAKLIVAEDESEPLRAWLGERRGVPLITNSIGAVELHRLAARVSQQASSAAVLLLARIDLLSLTPGALAAAAHLPPPEVRTLDALHVASAAELGDLEALVTYDGRMQAAATGYGLPVVSPTA